MNKIIFSEGGQPVYLDDIKLLQDNIFESFLLLFCGLFDGEYSSFLLQPLEYETEILDEDKGVTKVTIKDNWIVFHGEMIRIPTSSFLNTELDGKDLYLCIKFNDEDVRTFEDGQNRSCIRRASAYLSFDCSGAYYSNLIRQNKSVKELICQSLHIPYVVSGWENVPVVFYNGYSGIVRYMDDGQNVEIHINISSSHHTWDNGYEGVLFKILDRFHIDRLSSLSSPIGIVNVPVDENGNLMGTGSRLFVSGDGKCVIMNRVEYTEDFESGYIPPCDTSASKGIINTILKK